MRLLNILLLLIVRLTASEWAGCILQSDEDKGVVKRDKVTPVCLTIGRDGNWARGEPYSRYSFKPVADEYSRFTVQGSYKSMLSDSQENFSVFASSHKKLSFLRWYSDKEFGIFPRLTAIVDVRDGEVQGIAWDDACVFCDAKRCQENTYTFDGEQVSLAEPTKGCYYTKEECDEIHSKGGDACDLTLHVVWTGTDTNGNFLTSSNKRYSAFNPKQIRDQLSDAINSILPDVDWPWLK
mmetsp:Transcript_27032/g.40003  ORF Transcript_27032/g.40003 Transcript_27032/m.40003 type:complete len:238 (-) Transcript_27032:158-871(-)|eukprot:CAMPEP_0194079382 /NCGR_PEP_ID=MMETSP0149-20130528/5599_1 /TAXON_ID=122233 /ORGANISM="Chaetoceros debilis, Strain MM31A-1" /LENGTH=237 /DNA_ID=CAMNT_0038760867 /DNA_START=99 /DNA_END=812 /DNA_ORIENTATION=-